MDVLFQALSFDPEQVAPAEFDFSKHVPQLEKEKKEKKERKKEEKDKESQKKKQKGEDKDEERPPLVGRTTHMQCRGRHCPGACF